MGKKNPSACIWEINAETLATLSASMRELATALAQNAEEKKELDMIEKINDLEERDRRRLLFIKLILKRHPGWLLIYDNVESLSTIIDYLPQDTEAWGTGQVIITTRNAHLTHADLLEPEKVLNIESLSLDEALTLFLRILSRDANHQFSQLEREQAIEFLSRIPPFPLDVSIAAHYINSFHCSYEEYIKLLEHQAQQFYETQEFLLKESSEYTKTRYGIIVLSLKKLLTIEERFIKLVLLISLIDSQNIPIELLDCFYDRDLTYKLLHELKKYSLITDQSFSSISLHRSTQAVCLAYLIKGLNLSIEQDYMKHISKIFEDYLSRVVEKEDFPKMKLLENHCIALMRHDLLSRIDKEAIGFELGRIYYYTGENKKAEKVLQSTLQEISFPNNLLEAKIHMYLGTVYRDFGNFEKARNFLEKSLYIYKTYFPTDHINIARILMFLGNVYKDLSFPKKAQELLEESLLLYQKVEDPIGLSHVLTYLGTIYREMGKYEKAETILKKSLEVCKSQPNDPLGMALSLARLGNLYREIGKYSKSLECLKHSLKIYKDNSSNNNINIGWVLTYLGLVYRDLGNYDAALKFVEAGLEIHQQSYSKNNINLGWVLTYLGGLYIEKNEYEKAQQALEKGLQVYQNGGLRDDVNIGWNLLYLAICLKKLKKEEESKHFLQQSFLIYEKYFKNNDINVTWMFPFLGEIYRKVNQTEFSFSPLTEDMISIFEKEYGKEHIRMGLALD